MKWFKHDSFAHTDTKLKKLKHKYGITGYGLYWYCIELIAGKVERNNITFQLEDDAETIALDWQLDQIKVQEIMLYMCNIGLFNQLENGVICCLKLAKRLDDTNAKNPEIKAIIQEFNRNNSDILQHTPNNSDQTILDKTILDKTILDKNKDTSAKTSSFRVPVQAIVDLYHEKLPHHPKMIKITKTRRGQIKQRWENDLGTIEAWEQYFDHVSDSDFLAGKTQPGNGRHAPFKADLEWLTKEANLTKVIEGKYHA